MGGYLWHRYRTVEEVSSGDVRDAVSALTSEDISVSSPISAGGDEVATAFADDGDLIITVEGYDGDWTLTSEEELRRTISSINGVYELLESDGGYDNDG